MEQTGMTIASLFEYAGEVMTGYVGLATDFFNGLWEHPMGQLIISLTLVSGAIGLCYRLFLGKKKTK